MSDLGSTSDAPNPLWCSTWARREGVDPIGTAGSYGGYLVVEAPLPWPRDVGELPLLAPVLDLLGPARVRLQAIVPERGDGRLRLACYRWSGKGGPRFVGRELVVDPHDVPDAARALLVDGAGTALPTDAVEVLVCTHGRRDRCCGSLGTSLAQQLAEPGAMPEGVSVRRTSHTGGHRFAPTAIVLPEGTAWAFADGETLRRVVTRSGPLEDLLARYRGCAGMATPRVQAVERAVAQLVGWELFDLERSGSELEGDVVRLIVRRAGADEAYEATVRVGRTLPVPGCGEPVELAVKSEQELVVEGLHRVDAVPVPR